VAAAEAGELDTVAVRSDTSTANRRERTIIWAPWHAPRRIRLPATTFFYKASLISLLQGKFHIRRQLWREIGRGARPAAADSRTEYKHGGVGCRQPSQTMAAPTHKLRRWEFTEELATCCRRSVRGVCVLCFSNSSLRRQPGAAWPKVEARRADLARLGGNAPLTRHRGGL